MQMSLQIANANVAANSLMSLQILWCRCKQPHRTKPLCDKRLLGWWCRFIGACCTLISGHICGFDENTFKVFKILAQQTGTPDVHCSMQTQKHQAETPSGKILRMHVRQSFVTRLLFKFEEVNLASSLSTFINEFWLLIHFTDNCFSVIALKNEQGVKVRELSSATDLFNPCRKGFPVGCNCANLELLVFLVIFPPKLLGLLRTNDVKAEIATALLQVVNTLDTKQRIYECTLWERLEADQQKHGDYTNSIFFTFLRFEGIVNSALVFKHLHSFGIFQNTFPFTRLPRWLPERKSGQAKSR